MDRLRARARDESPGIFASLDGVELVAREGAQLRMRAPSGFHAKRLRDRMGDLETLCERFFGGPTRVELEEAGDRSAARRPADRREAARRLRQEALKHPSINEALELLDGEIVDIKPIGPGVGARP